jgi:geranylgeranyl diphosphate synthase type II
MLTTLDKYKQLIDSRLDYLIPDKGRLEEAMRYSLLAGGKRIRPTLTLEFARLCGAVIDTDITDIACAAEMLHTYSLIHDDLPCMDNDALRRGKPTNHVVYGEWLALLAGDALQAEAFSTIFKTKLPPGRKAQAAKALAAAAGYEGMCGGQYLDITGENNRDLTAAEIYAIHEKKTAALIKAACVMGCTAAGAGRAKIRAAETYGGLIGLAFQIQDDILDVEGDENALGKPVGSDDRNKKSTFVTLYGIERCKLLVEVKSREAINVLQNGFNDTEFLVWLTNELIYRQK